MREREKKEGERERERERAHVSERIREIARERVKMRDGRRHFSKKR